MLAAMLKKNASLKSMNMCCTFRPHCFICAILPLLFVSEKDSRLLRASYLFDGVLVISLRG